MSEFDRRAASQAQRYVETELALDIREISPARNFCSGGEARAINVRTEEALGAQSAWISQVLQQAKDIAERCGITQVVNIGCKDGGELVGLFPDAQFHTIGLGSHREIAACRRIHPTRAWLECDISSHEDLSRGAGLVKADVPAVFVLAVAVEQLADPRPLFAWLRTCLMKNEGSRLVISASDRLSARHEGANGAGEDKGHFREWALQEFERFLLCAGFDVVRSGHIGNGDSGGGGKRVLVEAACSQKYYSEFLARSGLRRTGLQPRHLLVTTEYAGLHRTGGIGTFVREQRELYGFDQTLCLFVAELEMHAHEQMREADLISPTMLLETGEISSLPIEDQVLKAVQQLLFYFPEIETVQYGEYQGAGCRVAQAKQAGLLPKDLLVIVHCHGATHYLENGEEKWYGASHFGVAEKEKISIEKADVSTFPTHYLQTLYADAGILPPKDSILIRYPYRIPRNSFESTCPCDTLIFYGKRSAMKGYGLFLRTLVDGGVESWREKGLKRIIFVGPKTAGEPEEDRLLNLLRQSYLVDELTGLGRDDAVRVIRENAHHALCVMPYLADNHPYALLDAVFATALPIMVRAGGVPEMLPDHFRESLLAEPDIVALRRRIEVLMTMSVEALHELRLAFGAEMTRAQEKINEQVRMFPSVSTSFTSMSNPEAATVIVPVFNTPIEYLRDLVFGLNNQTLKPAEVVFIDDASERTYAVEMAELITRELRLPFRIIRHEVNKGLAGARNTGLAAVNTEFVINIDSDDVPLNDFVREIVGVLSGHPKYFAAVPYLAAFDDGTEFNRVNLRGYVYRPLGEGVIASQVDNLLGHANSGFRTTVVRDLGGWDSTSKSMWEDWALYLRATSVGCRIAVIPKVGCLYRVRPQSMLRTYKVWPAMCRLARNMGGLPRFENFRLQAVARDYAELGKRAALFAQREAEFRAAEAEFNVQVQLFRVREADSAARIAELERELNRESVRAVRRLAGWLARHQRLFRAARWVGSALWKIGRALRRTLRAEKIE